MPRKGTKRVTYYEIGFPVRKVVRYERRSQRRKDTYALLPLWIVIGGIIIGNISNGIGSFIDQVFAQEPELLSPYVETYESVSEDNLVREVRSDEADVGTSLSVHSQQGYSHEDLVREVFQEKAEEALKIMQCESRGNSETVGDKHIMVYDPTHDEMVGDSIGLFQVRTGGNGWNRARANGMTADEFRSYLKNPENNIRYAKEIYDNAGSWKPWFNCMRKVL